MAHYLGRSDRYDALDRLKMLHETMRQVCSHESAFHQVMSVHAEGSMAAQKMMFLAESPMQRYETLAHAFAQHSLGQPDQRRALTLSFVPAASTSRAAK